MAVAAFGDKAPRGGGGKLGGADALFGDEESAGAEKRGGGEESHDFGEAVIGLGVAVGGVGEDDVGAEGRRVSEPCEDVGGDDAEKGST